MDFPVPSFRKTNSLALNKNKSFGNNRNHFFYFDYNETVFSGQNQVM